jgi:hypothetical protein
MTELRGCTRYFVAMDDAGFFPVGSTEMSVEVKWPAVSDAVGYRLYTMDQLRREVELEAKAHTERLRLNRRKAQRRARTGRR